MAKNHKKSAFSLLELSLTIIIIAILVIGVIGSRHIVDKARINAAKALSSSSPINGIYDNELWLETSIDNEAFGDTHSLTNGDNITSWFDRSNNQDRPQIEVVGSGPIYSNSINSIPAILFTSSSSSNHLKISDASFLNNTDYTIVITEQRVDQNSGVNYLLGGNDSNDTFGLGYSSNSAIIQTHGESSSSDNTATVETTATYSNKPRVIAFTHSSTSGNKIYINATLANEDISSNATSHLTGIGELNIGKNYHGEIGEIAIFSRALKQVEIVELEDYLTDKYNAPNNRDTNPNCVSGVVLSSGCDASCIISGVNGIDNQVLASGANSSYTCGTGYTGSTPTYSCVGGVLDPTPGADDCSSNSCDTGYLPSGDLCVVGCLVDNIDGTSQSGGGVADGIEVFCDDTNYDGSSLGTCSGGVTITGSCGCATGYDGSNCSSCATNYDDIEVSGVCRADCEITNEPGVTDLYVASGSTTTPCDDTPDVDDNITYSCSDGTLSNVVNSCNVPVCVGGDTTDDTTVSGETIHIFTTVGNATLTCYQSISAQILIVGGGGGGSNGTSDRSGGGGGGGGVVHATSYSLQAQDYGVVVGAGGTVDGNGVSSEFDSMIARGGGRGGSNNTGKNGGSGGGGSSNNGNNVTNAGGSSNQATYAGATSYGNNGGAGFYYSNCYRNAGGGGGGGAGEAGDDSEPPVCNNSNPELYSAGADGGDGIEINITGSNVYYGAGGGGGSGKQALTIAQGGLGGGGNGEQAKGNNEAPTTYATSGSGYGAGGGGKLGTSLGTAGTGYQGIVIIRYVNP